MDDAAELDVEIVEDWIFLYSKRAISTLDPAFWAWQFGVVSALLAKVEQWARWRDERLRDFHGANAASDSPAPAMQPAP